MIDIDNITKEQLMQIAHDDPRWIVESGFYVVNKDKDTVPFIFNEPQSIFYEERTTRDDLLKAGQLGLSTEILGILTVKFLFVPNSWSVCISHEDEATKRLFEKVEFFLRTMRPWLKPFYTPGKTTEGDMVNKTMNSKFYIGTAGARAFGRGDTIHYAHLSETSRWKGDGRLLTGVIRAVPLNDPHTWIVKETTANGEGTLHHKEYVRAKQNRTLGVRAEGFVSHFLPWFSNPKYRIPGAQISYNDLSSAEKRLIERFPPARAADNKGYVDVEAIAWRRAQIKQLPPEDGRNPEDIFKQEFPSDDKEAFLSTGNPVFSTENVENYKAKSREPISVGNLVGAQQQYTINEVEGGWLKLWDFPDTQGQYVIFADVGQFSDLCVATVVDRKSWATVAKFRAQIKSHAFGDELNKLGHFFNKAILAVEVNNMGQSTVDRLVDLNYPNMYMRKRFDTKEKKETKEYGWSTTAKTKSLIIGQMQTIINAQEADIPDIEILDELSTFINTDSGGMEASPGNHDDCVISVSGAYYLVKLYPYQEINKINNVVSKRVNKFRTLRSKGSGFGRKK